MLAAVRGGVQLDRVAAGCLDSVILPSTESKKQQRRLARPWPRVISASPLLHRSELQPADLLKGSTISNLADTIAVNLCLSFVSKGETREPLWLGNRSHNGGPWPLLSFQQPHHPPFSLIQTSSLPVTDQWCAFSSLLYTLLESLPFYRAVLLREAEGEKNDEVGLGIRGRSRVLIWFGLGQLASLPRSSHFISNVPFSSVCNRK